jgi:hypothetical protein
MRSYGGTRSLCRKCSQERFGMAVYDALLNLEAQALAKIGRNSLCGKLSLSNHRRASIIFR